MSGTPGEPRPLDYARRRPARPLAARVRGWLVDAASIAPALAVPPWAFLVTWRLSDHAGRPAGLDVGDRLLVLVTIAAPVAFALLACGPLAGDDRPRGR